MHRSWHYKRGQKYKTTKNVIDLLCDIVSRNGNLMLNIPLPNTGKPDDEELKSVEGITQWMAVNSEGIYGTRPWKISGNPPAAPPAGAQMGFNERNRKDLTAADVRYTTKGSVLYAFVMGWPEHEAVIPTLAEGPGRQDPQRRTAGSSRQVEIHAGCGGAEDRTAAAEAERARGHLQNCGRVMPLAFSLFCLRLRVRCFAAAPHPLTPLSAPEIRAAVAHLPRFRTCARKRALPLHRARRAAEGRGAAARRRAAARFRCDLRPRDEPHLGSGRGPFDGKAGVWKEVPGAQPPVGDDDSALADRIVRADPRWREAHAGARASATRIAWSITSPGRPAISAWRDEGGTAGRARHAVPGPAGVELLRAPDGRRRGVREPHDGQDSRLHGYRPQRSG